MKIGLKLWSINKNYIKHALAAYKNGFYSYIELFYVPGSMDLLSLWEDTGIPFVVHAPHTVAGLNPADPKTYDNNLKLAKESFEYAGKLKADFVIFHPGMEGSPEEVVRQIRSYGDAAKILIENKPYHSLHDSDLFFRGSNPEEIKYLMDHTKAGFCLDVGHAICAANSLKADKIKFIDEFISLGPKIYHLSDGDFYGTVDAHLSFGKGNYPLKLLLNKMKKDSSVTIETDKLYKDSLRDFEADVVYLRGLLG